MTPEFIRLPVAIDDIIVGDDRRLPESDKLSEIADSIKRVGLLNPISVQMIDDKPILVAGLHRVLALRALGETETVANVYSDLSETDAELIEITENLHRAELTVLQHAKQVARWIELTESKRASDEQDKPAQVAPVSKGGRGKESGINAAARELGIERTAAQRDVKIASLSPEADLAAVETGLDDNQSALLEAAKETVPEKQVAVLLERQRKSAEVRAACIALPAIAAAKAGDEKLKKQLAAANEKVKRKEEQRAGQESIANMAERQMESATNRAMYAEADKKRLQAEVDRLTEENTLLRAAKEESDKRYRALWACVNEEDRATFIAESAQDEVDDDAATATPRKNEQILICEKYALAEQNSDLRSLIGDLMEEVEGIYANVIDWRVHAHSVWSFPIFAWIGSDAEKRTDFAYPTDDDGNVLETDYAEPERDELIDMLLDAHSTGQLSSQPVATAKAAA